MGLDKLKPIVTRDKFEVDPFKATNYVLAEQSRTSLPTQPDDVVIDCKQSVYYSVEYALKKLLANDKFIEEYLSRSQGYISSAVERGLLSSLSTNVESNIEQIPIYGDYLNAHRSMYHAANDFQLSTVEEMYANADMSNFDEAGAQKTIQKTYAQYEQDAKLSSSNNISLSNDFVVETEFSDSPNVKKPSNYVYVAVSNAQTGHSFRQSMATSITMMNSVPQLTESTYIYKRWLSGFKELYIYIPTTFTMYQHNESGQEDINGNATWVQVKINQRHFSFNHIYQAHINGQSLPMQVHATESIPHYNDAILPSMLRTICASNDYKQNTSIVYDQYQAQYILYFVCYGTDAQAIRIFGD